MIVSYSPARKYVARLRAALPTSRRSLILMNWDEFLLVIADPSCLVPLIADLTRPDAVRRVRSLQRLHATVPIVIVTPTPVEGFFSSTVPHRIVAMDRMHDTLSATVEDVVLADRLQKLADAVCASTDLPVVIRRAVSLICTADEPYKTVSSLARDTGCHRTTLARGWRDAVRPGEATCPPMTLRRLVDWVFFLRSVVRKTRGKDWMSVARQMRVAPGKLRRICRRLVGRGLRRIGPEDVGWLQRELEQNLTEVLILSAPIDISDVSATYPRM